MHLEQSILRIDWSVEWKMQAGLANDHQKASVKLRSSQSFPVELLIELCCPGRLVLRALILLVFQWSV